MIIVAGRIYVREGRREAFVSASLEAVAAARRAPGCLDFVVAADPLEGPLDFLFHFRGRR